MNERLFKEAACHTKPYLNTSSHESCLELLDESNNLRLRVFFLIINLNVHCCQFLVAAFTRRSGARIFYEVIQLKSFAAEYVTRLRSTTNPCVCNFVRSYTSVVFILLWLLCRARTTHARALAGSLSISALTLIVTPPLLSHPPTKQNCTLERNNLNHLAGDLPT